MSYVVHTRYSVEADCRCLLASLAWITAQNDIKFKRYVSLQCLKLLHASECENKRNISALLCVKLSSTLLSGWWVCFLRQRPLSGPPPGTFQLSHHVRFQAQDGSINPVTSRLEIDSRVCVIRQCFKARRKNVRVLTVLLGSYLHMHPLSDRILAFPVSPDSLPTVKTLPTSLNSNTRQFKVWCCFSNTRGPLSDFKATPDNLVCHILYCFGISSDLTGEGCFDCAIQSVYGTIPFTQYFLNSKSMLRLGIRQWKHTEERCFHAAIWGRIKDSGPKIGVASTNTVTLSFALTLRLLVCGISVGLQVIDSSRVMLEDGQRSTVCMWRLTCRSETMINYNRVLRSLLTF